MTAWLACGMFCMWWWESNDCPAHGEWKVINQWWWLWLRSWNDSPAFRQGDFQQRLWQLHLLLFHCIRQHLPVCIVSVWLAPQLKQLPDCHTQWPKSEKQASMFWCHERYVNPYVQRLTCKTPLTRHCWALSGPLLTSCHGPHQWALGRSNVVAPKSDLPSQSSHPNRDRSNIHGLKRWTE